MYTSMCVYREAETGFYGQRNKIMYIIFKARECELQVHFNSVYIIQEVYHMAFVGGKKRFCVVIQYQ